MRLERLVLPADSELQDRLRCKIAALYRVIYDIPVTVTSKSTTIAPGRGVDPSPRLGAHPRSLSLPPPPPRPHFRPSLRSPYPPHPVPSLALPSLPLSATPSLKTGVRGCHPSKMFDFTDARRWVFMHFGYQKEYQNLPCFLTVTSVIFGMIVVGIFFVVFELLEGFFQSMNPIVTNVCRVLVQRSIGEGAVCLLPTCNTE